MNQRFEQFIDDVCVLVYAKNRTLTRNEQQIVRVSKNRLEGHGADVLFKRVTKEQYNKSKEETEALQAICEALGV